MHATMTGLICTVLCVSVAQAELRVGAAVTNITPQEFPVIVNGGMLSNQATEVNTPLHARAIVVDDGGERLAIVVVDSCMIPRPLCDEAKQLAAHQDSPGSDVDLGHPHAYGPFLYGRFGNQCGFEVCALPAGKIGSVHCCGGKESGAGPSRMGRCQSGGIHGATTLDPAPRPSRFGSVW